MRQDVSPIPEIVILFFTEQLTVSWSVEQGLTVASVIKLINHIHHKSFFSLLPLTPCNYSPECPHVLFFASDCIRSFSAAITTVLSCEPQCHCLALCNVVCPHPKSGSAMLHMLCSCLITSMCVLLVFEH